MINWCAEGNKVFWFLSDERDGRPFLRYPDGEEVYPSLNDYRFGEDWSRDKKYAYVRENLFLEAYDLDENDFAQMMKKGVEFVTQDKTYLFVSASHGPENIYHYLDDEQIAYCQDNILMFYSDPNLQAGWSSLILYPLAFEVSDDQYRPVYIGDIGRGESVLNEAQMNLRDFLVL